MMPMPEPPNELMRAALGYAARGWLVFPLHTPSEGLCSCSRKQDCQSPGKHPRTQNGLTEATSEASKVRDWWYRWPDANIGVRTGYGRVVLDVDPKNDGTTVGLDLPDTLRAITGSGGEHIWYSTSKPIPSRANVLGPGLDTRGEGGYVVAPPSLHVSGRRYEWDSGAPEEIAEAPEWLVERASRQYFKDQSQSGPAPDAFVSGGRNAGLSSLAGSMQRKGFARESILAALLSENARRCKPPLDDVEVRRIADSIARYPATDPVNPADPFAWRAPEELLKSDLPEFPWVIAGLQIGPGRPCGLFGYGGGGKSYVAQTMALAVATGTDFLRRFTVRQGRVRHVSHEMGLRSLKERYRRLASGLILDLEQIGDRLEVSAYPRVYLNSKEAEALYMVAARDTTLIIIDSLRRALPGEDENDSSISNYLDMLGRVSDQTSCTFLVLHHSGKGALSDDQKTEKRGAGRGSSAIEDASSCIWTIEGGGTGPRVCTQIRAHEDADGIIEQFYIDMPTVGVGDAPLYVSTRKPVRIDILSDEDVKKMKRKALVKRNTEEYEEAAELILEAVKNGAKSMRAVLKATYDSRKNRAIIKDLIEEGRLEDGVDGLVAVDQPPPGRFEWDPSQDPGDDFDRSA